MKNFLIFKLIKVSRFINLIFRIINPNSKLKLKLEDNLLEETFNHFKEDFTKSLLFNDVYKTREYAIQKSLLNDENKEYYYLEFGVFRGTYANYFSKFVNKLYCFDSFEGLKEDLVGTSLPKGYFNLKKKYLNLIQMLNQ